MTNKPQTTKVGKTKEGITIYCEPNEAGGNRYISDAIGGGVTIWDTSLTSKNELLVAMNAEKDIS